MSSEVVIVIVSRNVGGLERRWAALYRHLAKQWDLPRKITFIVSKAQVTTLARKYKVPSHGNLSLVPFGIPGKSSRLVTKLPRLARLLDYLCLVCLIFTRYRKGRFTAAHFVTQSSLIFAPLFRAEKKVMSVVNSGTFENLAKSPIFRKSLRKGFHVDHLSAQLYERVRELELASPERLHTAPCSFTDYEETGIGEKRPWLVYLSRFVEGKGLEILLPALPAILKRCPNLMVKIIGGGPLEEVIRKRIAQMTERGRVWVGFSEEPIEILRRSRIFLSLQRRENYPSQALLEAMACGNAVIATNVGLTRKIVDETVGVLIDARENQLIEAVVRLALDDSLADELGRNARRKVVREHSANRFKRYLESIYRCGTEG